MALNFPNSPTLSEVYTSGTTSYQWNGSAWILYTTGANAFIGANKLTAKGTLVSASTANTPETVPTGTNGYVLTANSTTVNGLTWTEKAASFSELMLTGM
jgi:hypothetical protein